MRFFEESSVLLALPSIEPDMQRAVPLGHGDIWPSIAVEIRSHTIAAVTINPNARFRGWDTAKPAFAIAQQEQPQTALHRWVERRHSRIILRQHEIELSVVIKIRGHDAESWGPLSLWRQRTRLEVITPV